MHKTDLFKNSLISGTLILTFTGILSRLIGFYYKIFLSRTIGAEGVGIYQLIFPVFALMISVSAAGIQTAISRYCAQCKTDREARGYLGAGLILSAALSVACTAAVRGQADRIAASLLSDPRTAGLLRLMSWSLLFACIHSCVNGYYYGKKKTAIPAVSQLLEQGIRTGGVYLIARVIAEHGQEATARIAVWGLLIGEFASMLFVVTMLGFSGRPPRPKSKTAGNYFRNLISLAAPLTLNRILLSVFQGMEALLIPVRLRVFGYTHTDALSVYGILTGMVFSTVMFPAVLSNSLSVMLLPAVSKACAANRGDLIRKAVRRTVESCTALGLVCTLGFLLTGNWIGTHLFHNTLAGIYIETLSWICPFVFLSGTLTSILHGLGRATATLFINLSGALVRIGFIFWGIPLTGLKAYLWGMLISQIWTAVAAGVFIRKCAAQRS